MLPPALVVVEGDDRTFPVHVPHGDPVAVWVVTEDGEEVDVEQLDVWVDPRTVSGLADDTQYSVVATATGGTIASIVIELAEGGDNAMIYEGFGATP